jgi:hypothetical protein
MPGRPRNRNACPSLEGAGGAETDGRDQLYSHTPAPKRTHIAETALNRGSHDVRSAVLTSRDFEAG